MPKVYLWNENAFKSFEITFNVDLNKAIEQSLQSLGADMAMLGGENPLNLLDSLDITRDLTRLERYKQIRNMDYQSYEVRDIIEHDQLLLMNKKSGLY